MAYNSEKKSVWRLSGSPKYVTEYIIELEKHFVHFNEIPCRNGLGSILKFIFINVNLNHPCANFPYSYLLSLYIRVSIYYLIKIYK